ncbi:MAG: hypothetical protein ACRDIY_08505 [Chloroflexota bacterium]
MVVLMTLRIITELIRLFFVMLDSFIMDLGGRSETGLRGLDASARTWVKLPGMVLLGIAFVVLQLIAIFTVFFRQASTKVNDFVIGLAEGEERILGLPAAQVAPMPMGAGAGGVTSTAAPQIAGGANGPTPPAPPAKAP